jgi:hypothetical protein
MKKNLVYIYCIFLCLIAFVSISFTTPPANLNIKTKVSIFAEDPSKREIEFSTDCKDCGPVFIYVEGKYAGQIDTKFRDRTILVKIPGSYNWKAKTDAGLTSEGTVDCP